MDRFQSANPKHVALSSLPGISPLETLPSDVLPNIYGRLPTCELFALASVSKHVQGSIQALLPDAAERELGAISVDSRAETWKRLSVLLRDAAHHISKEAWTNFLTAAHASGIDRRMIQLLLLSAAREDAELRTCPDAIAHASDDEEPEKINGCRLKRGRVIQWVCVLGMREMMRAERLRSVGSAKPIQLSCRPAWKELAGIYETSPSLQQVELLLIVKPRKTDGANIMLAFDEIVAVHLANLVENGNFFFIANKLNEEDRCDYFDMLSNAYTMAPSPYGLTYFQLIFRNIQLGGKVLPSQPDSIAYCTLVLRSLAYETRTNQIGNEETFSSAITSCASLTCLAKNEVNHFIETLNQSMDQGMALEEAVNLWIIANRMEHYIMF